MFPFLIDTGSSKTLVDDALARKLHLTTVGRPIKVTGVGCSEAARKVRLRGWSIRRPAPSEYHRHQSSSPVRATDNALGCLGV